MSTTGSRRPRTPTISSARTGSTRAVTLVVYKQPGVNVVQVVDDIKALMPTFRQQLPPSIALEQRSDRSLSIRDSVEDVKVTLLLTIVLVVAVIFLFLRNVSATVIPSLALPASIVATFAVMYLLHYSLDNLSLMALTLSVGFVVDDAIVMLENIVRHMEMGKSPMQAVLRRVGGDLLHDPVDDHLARGGVHPDPLHGRHRRTAAARVLGHHRRRHPRVGVRVDQPDADALQPVPEAAAHQKHGWFYNATERMFDSWLRALRLVAAAEPQVPGDHDGDLDRAARRHGVLLQASSRPVSCRSRIRAASTSTSKRPRASATTR